MTTRAAKRGKLFVVSAPSGAGKSTLCERLLNDDLGLVRSLSVTTRPPRGGEKEGVDYHFVSKKDFEAMVARDAFLEREENFGYFYGTPKRPIEEALEKGKSALLNIDVKGAMNVRKAYPKESVLIFILPPSIEVLKKRLASRNSDTAETISARLKFARKEMSYKEKYDYRIVNDKLDTAYKELREIIRRESR
ncbi:MAG: guanylate kinase [Candidatus Omnitrophica bacterium]|nr:guanylate kinase [Candidatus Omnitrophota bacterium]